VLSCIAIVALSAISVAQADWPGWRGDGSGHVQEGTAPVKWNSEKGVAWKSNIPGRGVSTPIIVGNKIFVTTATDAEGQHPLRNWIRLLFIIMVTLLIIHGVAELLRKREEDYRFSWRHFAVTASFIGFFVLMSVILELLTSPDSSFHGRGLSLSSLPRLWIVSGVISTSGILASFLLLRDATITRKLLGYLAITLFIAFYIFVPDDEIVFPKNAGQYVGWGIASLGLICGLISTSRYGVYLTASGIVLTLGYVIYLVVLHKFSENPEIVYENHQYRFWLMTGFMGAVGLFGAGRALIMAFDHAYFSKPSPLTVITASTIFLVASLEFYFINFLMPAQGLTRSLVCLDFKTGETLWTSSYFSAERERVHNKNSHATPTPVSDGSAVYAYFGNSGIMCVDLDGNQLWVNKSVPYDDKYGAASSPLVKHGLVYLSCIDLEAPYVAALDAKNGDLQWKVPYKATVGSYATPWLGNINGTEQLIVNGGKKLNSFNPLTGDVLWSLDHEIGEVVPSPIITDQWILGGGDRRILAYQFTEAESSATAQVPQLKWETQKGAPFHCSMLLKNEQLISLSDQGVLTALDLNSGKKVLWQKRLAGNFTASPLLIGDTLYASSREGLTYVLKLEGKKAEIIAENDLGVPHESSLAYSDGQLIVRTPTQIWCIQGTKDTPLESSVSQGEPK
jgi:outer membrane protein assembly factor BamB